MLEEQRETSVRVFVIWEPVLPSDLLAPSTSSLKRISDPRVSQYWDKPRLVSHSMGETDHNSIVWDYVAVYEAGKLWDKVPPEPAYSGSPLVDVITETRTAINLQLGIKQK